MIITPEDANAALILLRMGDHGYRDHIAKMLEAGTFEPMAEKDSVICQRLAYRDKTAEELTKAIESETRAVKMLYDHVIALIVCTDGERDEEIATILGLSPEKISEARARELAKPPEEGELDLFGDQIAQKKEEARRKLIKLRPISSTPGYNGILEISAKNNDSFEGGITANPKNENTKMLSATMKKRNRRGESELTVRRELSPEELKALEAAAKKDRERFDTLFKPELEAVASRWRTSTKKMLDYSVIKLNEKNTHLKRGKLIDIREIDTLVTFTLEEWCNLRGKPNTEATLDFERTRAKEDCQTLADLQFRWSERRGHKKNYTFFNPIQLAELKGNRINIRLAQDLAKYLLQAPISQYMMKLLSTDERNPNAYALARKLGDFANIKDNASRKKKKPTDNQYKISVSALIDCTSIPKPEDVENREYKRLIITPFLLAMAEAERVLGIDWAFISETADSQIIDKNPPSKIGDFMEAYILYSFKGAESLANLL